MIRSVLVVAFCVGVFLVANFPSVPAQIHARHGHRSEAAGVTDITRNPPAPKTLLYMLAVGHMEQPACCRQWDLLSPSQKAGRKHMHGALSKMAGVPVMSLTSLALAVEEDCKNRPICVMADDPLLGKPGIRSCHSGDNGDCRRQCGDKRPIQGCRAWCCENKCACPGDCP